MWPVLAVLLAAAVVPSVCVLWFMNAAASQVAALPPQQAFAVLVRDGAVHGAIICDADCKALYPAVDVATPAEEADWLFIAAENLEFVESDFSAAAAEYERIATAVKSADVKVRAVTARARCVAKSGDREAALRLLAEELSPDKVSAERDPAARSAIINAMLYATELCEKDSPSREVYAKRLGEIINDNAGPAVPLRLRLFVMQRLSELAPGAVDFPTMAAEEIACNYQDSPGPAASEKLQSLPAATGETMWHIAFAGGRIVALYDGPRLVGELNSAVAAAEGHGGATISLVPPGGKAVAEPLLSVGAGEQMPGWSLSVVLDGDNPFDSAAGRHIAAYLWTAVGGIATIALLAAVIGRRIGREIRLTRLKNDLIATVSHELKTPLASMRLLIDTLVEGRYRDSRQVEEYFALISRENERLTRLIDNFLTFSRMERNKQAFDFAPTDAGEIVNAAAAAVADRFNAPCRQLVLAVDPALPRVAADRDAIVTVLINLLDNAYKYSGEVKHVAVRAMASDGCVSFAVSDNGIGLSRRAARRVFDKFYQVDSSLSRRSGGCGLGLSIVKFIVDAHGGQIDVHSKPGAGSTFTVRLPAERKREASSNGE